MPAKKQRKDASVLTGRRFGRWRVLSQSAPRVWQCRCACGSIRRVDAYSLLSGHSKSCGCQRAEIARQTHRTHGMRQTAVYAAWCDMRKRCLNVDSTSYKHYGGRGIGICRRWQKFENFLADMGPRPRHRSLDRIDNSRGYSPKNCRWATKKQQMYNRRCTLYVRFRGRKVLLAALASQYGLAYGTLHQRIYRYKWEVSRAVLQPSREKKKKKKGNS